MNPGFLPLTHSGSVFIGGFRQAEAINNAILGQYRRLGQSEKLKRTHFFMGRFENTYIPEQQIPAISEVINLARYYALEILGEDTNEMKMGFWFNEMQPGHETSLHTHEEYEEKLSAVYYIQATRDSGDLVVHENDHQNQFAPVAGRMILFAPELPHQVQTNNSDILRLSVAINFGY